MKESEVILRVRRDQDSYFKTGSKDSIVLLYVAEKYSGFLSKSYLEEILDAMNTLDATVKLSNNNEVIKENI